MKIEMGESLLYSWLRHIRGCQLVQTNWKASTRWEFKNTEEIENLLTCIDTHYQNVLSCKIFKKISSLSQMIKQAECDVLGIRTENESVCFYAVDVAFHEQGLCYGTKWETVAKVVAKFVRTAFCLYGYFDIKKAEIVFAAPKISDSILRELSPCIEHLNGFFKSNGFDFQFQLICNKDFEKNILQEVIGVSGDVADTAELFLRSYQMYAMFDSDDRK